MVLQFVLMRHDNYCIEINVTNDKIDQEKMTNIFIAYQSLLRKKFSFFSQFSNTNDCIVLFLG